MKNNHTKVITMSCNEAQKLMFAMVLYSLNSNISINQVKEVNVNRLMNKMKIEAILLKQLYEKIKQLCQQRKSLKIDTSIDTFEIELNSLELGIFGKIYADCSTKLNSIQNMKIDEVESIISVLNIQKQILEQQQKHVSS